MRLLKKITSLLLASLATCIIAQAQDTPLFQVTPGSKVCLGQQIQVTDFSTGGNGAVSYTFGDGTNSGNANPTHTYVTANTFTIKQILPISGTVIDPSTGNPVGYLTYSEQVKVVPNTSLSATYTVCGSGRVNVNISDTRFDSYDVDFGDGTGIVNVPNDPSGTTQSVHIYSTFTAHTISIKGKFIAGNYCPSTDFTLSVTPIAAVPKPDVVFMETTTEDPANGELTVQIINNTPFDYEWDFKRNGFSYTSNIGTISSTSGTSSLVLNKTNTNPYDPATQAALHASYALNTKQDSYCIRLATKTTCGREILSDEICSITKFTATAADLQNDLIWEAYSGPNISSVDVIRDSAPLASLAGTAASYNDAPLPCAVLHCYRVKGILSTTSSLGPQYSLGAQKCITSTSLTPRPALTNVNSTINGSDVTVTFDPPTGGFTAKSYTVLEAVNGGSFNPAGSNAGSPNSFTLTGRTTSADSYCYQVNYTDLCNLSPANGSAVTTCPIKLHVGLAEDGTVAINWTTYAGSTAATTYTVEVRDENGTVIKTIPGGSGNSATDLLSSSSGQLYYIVLADNGSTSALIELVLSPAVYVPTAFSPNNDGANDYFELKGRFIKNIDLSIFNRWGEPVFHSTDMKNQWDGKVNGGDATVGTYAYTLEVTGQRGEVIKQKGTITLAR
jgi:gliding motility-associated-like protein